MAQITLNNPARHNALGREQLEALRSIIRALAQDADVRVLVVTGVGEKTFCAGASLGELGAGEIDDDAFQGVMRELCELAVPTICALNGNVFGGGVELALSCDFRIGVEGTRMQVPAAVIGLCYPAEGIKRFLECLGPQVVRRVLMSAEEFDAAGMLEIGFLDQLVEREALERTAEQLAARISGLAPLAVRSMKQLLRPVGNGPLNEGQAVEFAALCRASSDLQEGLAAKQEKRTPDFSGS